jgi:hypothetical protein
VLIHNNMAIVGAPRQTAGALSSGAVYLMDLQTGSLLQTLSPNDASIGQGFGGALAAQGNTLLIGSAVDASSGGEYGSAYVFDLSTGEQMLKIQAPDPTPNARFGASLDVHGELAVIGAPGHYRDGAAYVFSLSTGDLVHKLQERGNQFGSDVAINDSFILVGDQAGFTRDAESGSGYLYNSSTFEFVTELIGSDTDIGDGFGSGVALTNGNLAVVGAWQAGNPGQGTVVGAAYVYAIVPEPSSATVLASVAFVFLCFRTQRQYWRVDS